MKRAITVAVYHPVAGAACTDRDQT